MMIAVSLMVWYKSQLMVFRITSNMRMGIGMSMNVEKVEGMEEKGTKNKAIWNWRSKWIYLPQSIRRATMPELSQSNRFCVLLLVGHWATWNLAHLWNSWHQMNQSWYRLMLRLLSPLKSPISPKNYRPKTVRAPCSTFPFRYTLFSQKTFFRFTWDYPILQ